MDNKSDYSDPTADFETRMFYSPVTYLNYPVRDALCFVIPLTFIYSIIFISGILGNVITCIVIIRNKNMHTATNYYLFSLAMSDLLLLVSGKFLLAAKETSLRYCSFLFSLWPFEKGLPQEIYNMWYRYPYPFNESICILQGFAAETSSNATVLTITAFTLERWELFSFQILRVLTSVKVIQYIPFSEQRFNLMTLALLRLSFKE